MASSEEGGDWGLECRVGGFCGDGSWVEWVVCHHLPHVEHFDMSQVHSKSLGCKSCENAGQDDDHSTLNCIGNKVIPMLSPQCGKCILMNIGCGHVMGTSTERWNAWLSCETWIMHF